MQPVTAVVSPEEPTSAAAASRTGPSQAPGSTAFAALAEADVAAEDVFFHRYFTMDRVKQRRAAAARTRALKRKAKKKTGSGSDVDSEDDVVGEEDGSAAEDDFLDGLEQLPVCSSTCCVMLVHFVANQTRLLFSCHRCLCCSCMFCMVPFRDLCH